MTASSEAQQLGHVLADWRESDDEPDADARNRIARLLAQLSDDEFEAMREPAIEVLGVEPDRLDTYRELGADPEVSANELEQTLAHFEADEDAEPDGAAKRRIGWRLGEVSDDDFEALRERAADVLECEPGAIDRHRRLEQYRADNGSILVEDGRTWRLGGVPLDRYEILNFELGVNSFLEVDDEPLLVDLRVEKPTGEAFDKTVSFRIFNRRQRFDDGLLAELGGMTFDSGPVLSDDDALDALNLFIDSRDAPKLTGTHHMGLHGDEWVLPGGSLTADGWTDEPQTVYLERDLEIERKVALPTDRDEYDADDVGAILRELPKMRPTDRLLPVLGWFYAAPFRPVIYDDLDAGGFNLLNITGDTGAGKTNTLRYVWRCFGMDGEPFSVNDSRFTTTATMGATNSIPAWYDEYKPSSMEERRKEWFHDFIKKAATGGVEQRGQADLSTVSYKLEAPVAISGEQQIQRPAERRRSILVTFRAETTDAGTSYREAFKRLTGQAFVDDDELVIPGDKPDPKDHALAYYRYVAGLDRETVTERWYDALERVAEYRGAWDGEHDLDDMEVQGVQTVLFGWANYLDFAEQHGVDAGELPSEAAVEDALRHVVGGVGPAGRRKSHLEQFIELMSRAAGRGYLEPGDGGEYAVVKEGSESEELRFNVGRTYDAISKYVRDHDLGSEDLLGSADDYRGRIREAEKGDGRLVVTYSQNTPPIGRCAGISTREASHRLDFEPGAFGLGGQGDDDDETAATALDSLPPSGYLAVEAEVADFETPAPNGEPGASGALRDSTAVVDMVCWRDLADLDTRPESGETYRFEDVRAGTFNGAPQVEIVPGVTAVEPIQAGVGHSAGDEADESQATLAASDGGEIEDVTGRVREHLRVNFESGDAVSISEVAGALHVSPDQAKHGLEHLADAGRVMAADDDRERFEVV